MIQSRNGKKKGFYCMECDRHSMCGTNQYCKDWIGADFRRYCKYYSGCNHTGCNCGISVSSNIRNSFDYKGYRACDGRNELWKYDGCSEEVCLQQCKNDSRCISVEYQVSKKRCQLSSSCDYNRSRSKRSDWKFWVKL